MKTLQTINCYVHAVGTPWDEEDENVPGWYLFEVTLNRAVDVHQLSAQQGSEIASAVLDSFSEHQGIECPDDFLLTVYLNVGTVVSEDPGEERTGLVRTASHCGKVGESEVPFAVEPGLAAFRARLGFDAVMHKAREAFWSAIADAYPEIKSGDLPPDVESRFSEASETAVDAWLAFNAPESVEVPIKVGDTFRYRKTQAEFEVVQLPRWEVAFCQRGGGVLRRMSRIEFCESFDSVDPMAETFVPGYFNIDQGPFAVPGYSKPNDRWNGWSKPYFAKEAAEFLASKLQELHFDEARNAFVMVDQSGEEPAVYEAVEIDVPGKGTVTVYPIGAGEWVWDRYERESDLPSGTELPTARHQ